MGSEREWREDRGSMINTSSVGLALALYVFHAGMHRELTVL